MSDERQAFEQLHAIPSGAIWCENRDVYIHKNYSGLVLHPINESWEAFCEGALWQASRQDFECEPVAEVAQVGGTPVVFWDKSLTVGTKLYTRPASRHALSSCSEIPNSSGHASRQALEGEPVAWWDGDTSAAEDSFSFKLNRCYTIPLYTHPASAAKQAVSVPSILYDGYAVFQEVQHARNSKGLENIKDSALVSDVLDAVVKLIKQEQDDE